MLALPEKIITNRLYLERLRYEFAEEIFFGYASKPEATRFVSWPTHKSINDTRDYLDFAIRAWERGTDYSYAIRMTGSNRFMGSIGCINNNGNVQFGYILNPVFWNQGFATEASRQFLFNLKRASNVHRIWTFTDVANVASQRVLLKNGLVEETRKQAWYRFINQGDIHRDCVVFKMPDEFLSINLVSK